MQKIVQNLKDPGSFFDPKNGSKWIKMDQNFDIVHCFLF